jgi:signal transduction histidine kinase
MATGGLAERIDAPSSRTRSIWLTQLVLAASVVLIAVLVLLLQPELYVIWNFALGVLMMMILTTATIAVPWSRVPPRAVFVVPFLDAVAIGFMATATDLRFGYLWAFPVMWIAMHASLIELGGVLMTVVSMGAIGVVLTSNSTAGWLRVLVVFLSLGFVGMTAHLAMRQMRALRKLLRRQAQRLTVTLARRSDEERRTSEILNGVDIGVARISLSGRALTVNDAYARLYGLDSRAPDQPARSVEYRSMRGMPIPYADRPFVRAGRGESFSEARVWLFTPAGEWRVLSITSKRLRASANEEAGMLLLVHDVTAVTFAEHDRQRLAAIASHEMKHPLTVMVGNAELALETEDLAPRTRERLERILSASERLVEMTSSMVNTSQTRLTERESFGEIDLGTIVLESVDSFRPTALANGVAIQTTIEGPLSTIADGFRMRQVVDNIVSNAIKYTPRKGSVTVEALSAEEGITLRVSDDGIGISQGDLRRISKPYFRAAAAREVASGTGLGLGITREIVSGHGGTFDIESRGSGLGTTVTIRLPRVTADQEPVMTEAPA